VNTLLVTAPSVEPVTMQQVRDYIKQDDNNEDAFISELIVSSRRMCERFTRRALITQTWKLFLDNWPSFNSSHDWWDGTRQGADIPHNRDSIDLPQAPLQSITSITTYDDADVATVWASSNYFVDSVSEPGRIVVRSGSSWPTTARVANGIEIVFVCGYGIAPQDVPQELRDGMLKLISKMFQCRGDSVEKAASESEAEMLWSSYRIITL